MNALRVDRSDTVLIPNATHKTTEAVVINLQVASGLVSFAGFISGVIADWGIAACTGNEHLIMHMISIMEGSGKR